MTFDKSPNKAAFLMLGATFFFSLMVVVSKVLSTRYDTAQQVFFRNLIGVVFVLASLYRRPAHHKGGRMLLLISRGVIGTLSLYLLFYAISTLGIARSTTYQYTYPMFMALFSFLFFRERPAKREMMAIIVGFIGIWFIFRPDMDMPVRNHIIGLGNALLTTFAYLAIKQLSHYYDARYIVLSFMLSGLILPLLSVVGGYYFEWEGFDFLLGRFIWADTLFDWVLFAALGLSALAGQVLMTHAFANGKATQVAPIGYASILFATLSGMLMGESVTDPTTILGMLMIVGGGLLITAFPTHRASTIEENN